MVFVAELPAAGVVGQAEGVVFFVASGEPIPNFLVESACHVEGYASFKKVLEEIG